MQTSTSTKYEWSKKFGIKVDEIIFPLCGCSLLLVSNNNNITIILNWSHRMEQRQFSILLFNFVVHPLFIDDAMRTLNDIHRIRTCVKSIYIYLYLYIVEYMWHLSVVHIFLHNNNLSYMYKYKTRCRIYK